MFGQSTQLNQSALFTSNANMISSPDNYGNQSADGVIYLNSPNEVPKDSVEQIEFSPVNPTFFCLISWDSTLRVYEINNGQITQKISIQLPAQPLSFAWRSDGNAAYVSLSNNTLQLAEFSTGGVQKFADCQSTVHKIRLASSINALMAFDMSNKLSVYMVGNPTPVFNLQIKFPIIEVDISDNLLIMALGDSYSAILDISSLNQYTPNDVVYTESQLKSPLSYCTINAKTLDFVLASVDGRVQKGMAQIQNTGMGQNKKIYSTHFSANDNSRNFVFIAHSRKTGNVGISDMFAVNKCGFNSRSENFLYTAGSDGGLNFWDLKVKNKITSTSLNNSITAASVNNNGQYLAFATGYDWSKGVWGLGEVSYTPRIGIRTIKDNELVYNSGTPGLR